MAREFSKSGSNNFIDLGLDSISPLINGASAVSVSVIFRYDTLDSSNANNNRVFDFIIDGTKTGLMINIDTTGPHDIFRLAARSQTSDSLKSVRASAVPLSSGTIYRGGAVYDFASSRIRGYLDTASGKVIDLGAAFGSGTYVAGTPTNNDAVPTILTDTASQWDGMISEVAIWNIDIGDDGFDMLHTEVVSTKVKPSSLVAYWSLSGRNDPEQGIWGGIDGDVDGPTYADHPRIFYPPYQQRVSAESEIITPDASFGVRSIMGDSGIGVSSAL